ncbi:MAG: glycosyltransferase family 39 protein [Solirubrobacteraceae bacterium]
MSVWTLTREADETAASHSQHRARARRRPDRLLGGVVLLTVLGAALRFTYLGRQGFWFDEANTVLLVHMPLGKMLGLIPQSESTPPLYYCLVWVWSKLFGYGEAGLRSFSALAGVTVVPVVYEAARRLISPRAALIAAALAACNPMLIWYSQETRSYSLLALMSAGTLLTFALVREQPTPRRLAAWVIGCALALATHYYALLAVVPEAVVLLVTHWRRSTQFAIVAVGLCGLGLVPLAVGQNGTGHVSWIAHSPLSRRLLEIIPQFAIGFGSPAYGVLEPVAVAVAIGAAVLAVCSPEVRRQHGTLLVGGLAVAGLVIDLGLVGAGVDDLITRNVIAILPATLLLAAGGLASRRAVGVGLLLTAVLCAIGVTAAIGVASDRALQRPDWRVVARALGPRPSPGPGIQGRAVLIQHYRDLLPLSLYLPRLHFMSPEGAVVSELDIISFTSPPSAGFCWWGSACNLWPSRMQHHYALPGFRTLWRGRANQFTILRLVASPPSRLTALEVSRALRSTRLGQDDLLLQR